MTEDKKAGLESVKEGLNIQNLADVVTGNKGLNLQNLATNLNQGNPNASGNNANSGQANTSNNTGNKE